MMEENNETHSLLDRAPPPEYLKDWETLLAQEREGITEEPHNSILVFRLYNEWLAISSESIKEIIQIRKIHSIPHKNSNILIGTVNIGGQLKLAVSLENILEIDLEEEHVTSAIHKYKRMLVLKQENDLWVSQVHEVFGMIRLVAANMQNVPVTISKSTANYLKGIIRHEDKCIGVLEDELIFFKLRRCIE